MVRLLLLLLRVLLLVALIGVGVDGLSVPGRLTHLVLGLLLVLLNGLSSDWLLRNLLVMHLDHDILTLGVVAADCSIIFGYPTSAFGTSDARDYAEDKEECSECPPEPDESGMAVALVTTLVVIATVQCALVITSAVVAVARIVHGASV